MDKTVRSQCVISNVLEILGDRWTLLVIRDLFFFDKHEFKEFLASPESIATNVLTDRLKKLIHNQIISEIPHPETRTRKLYFLTQKGKDLLPILGSMAQWGSKHLPDLEAMQPLYERLRTEPKKVQSEINARIEKWEREYLQ
jgi:DNA-binding HxlR family transcriptional regulator